MEEAEEEAEDAAERMKASEDDPMPRCSQCKSEINKNRDHHCPTCDADYCANCCVSGGWTSVAAGVDYQYLDVQCPKGHAWREDSYL